MKRYDDDDFSSPNPMPYCCCDMHRELSVHSCAKERKTCSILAVGALVRYLLDRLGGSVCKLEEGVRCCGAERRSELEEAVRRAA